MNTPPEPFTALSHLTGPPTLERAKALTEALNTIPDLQKWLRQQRQETVQALHHNGISYTDMAPHLGVKPERVSGIARGHSRSPRKKASED